MPTSSFDKEFSIDANSEGGKKLLAALADPNPPKTYISPMKHSIEEQTRLGIEFMKKHLGNEITDTRQKDFDKFGYKSKTPCRVCGSKDTRTEPHFGYNVCIDHFHMSPVEMNKYPD